ncbi:uncharacterized protein ARMOST_10093 [Armillaria ostoyae]|uniref:CCHC-type domain-containing protein n=1 Tax=Armillaria ostoyae TaxID=47428 RepID=A0A284RDC4_ARMOS|nr:uncharacterized protein ARMOST_10093 [Armillaria ostoyae]
MGGLPQKGSLTSSGNKKTATGTVYGGRGQVMDINMMKADGKCFQCHEKGHISKNCLLQSWNKRKKKEEVRASTTKPAIDSKIKEVKDAARNHSGWTYPISVVTYVKYMLHSNIPALTTLNQPKKESHNRYTILMISTVSDNEATKETESLASDLPTSSTDNHLASSSSQVKVPGKKLPTIAAPIITASLTRPDGAEEPGPNSPPEQVENTATFPTRARTEQGKRCPRLHQAKAAAADVDTCRSSLKQKSPYENEAECLIGNNTSVSKGQEAAKHVPLMVPQGWLKPFKTEWTWRVIEDTKDESAARAILLNWIHKTQAEEVIDNLLKGLRSAEHFCALDWLDELCKSKQYFICSQTSFP